MHFISVLPFIGNKFYGKENVSLFLANPKRPLSDHKTRIWG